MKIGTKHQIRAARAILASLRHDRDSVAHCLGEAEREHKEGGVYLLVMSLIQFCGVLAIAGSEDPEADMEASIESLLRQQDMERLQGMGNPFGGEGK